MWDQHTRGNVYIGNILSNNNNNDGNKGVSICDIMSGGKCVDEGNDKNGIVEKLPPAKDSRCDIPTSTNIPPAPPKPTADSSILDQIKIAFNSFKFNTTKLVLAQSQVCTQDEDCGGTNYCDKHNSPDGTGTCKPQGEVSDKPSSTEENTGEGKSTTYAPGVCNPNKFNSKTWTNTKVVECIPDKPGKKGEKWTCEDKVKYTKTLKDKICTGEAVPSPEASESASPSSGNTPTSSPSFSSSTSGKLFTTHFRVAESDTNLDKAGWQPYINDPTVTNFTLSDNTPGVKQIWVEFRASNFQTRRETLNVTMAQPDPEISSVSCNLDSIVGQDLKATISGDRFGDKKGKVGAGGKPMNVLEWTDTQITAILKNSKVTTSASFEILLERADGQEAEEIPCQVNTSLLALGAKIFCRDEGQFEVPNVKVTIYEQTENGAITKVDENTKIDDNGTIKNLKTILTPDRNYAVSIKAPNSLRRNAYFTASEGTTTIDAEDGSNFILPIGDIAPVSGPDGTINSVDRAELVRQWKINDTENAKTLTADFNRDLRVNSFDWACMQYDINEKDDPPPTGIP